MPAAKGAAAGVGASPGSALESAVGPAASVLTCPLLVPSLSGRPGLSWRQGRVRENFLRGVWGRALRGLRGARVWMAAEL